MARSKTFADGEILTPADVNDHLVNHVPTPGTPFSNGVTVSGTPAGVAAFASRQGMVVEIRWTCSTPVAAGAALLVAPGGSVPQEFRPQDAARPAFVFGAGTYPMAGQVGTDGSITVRNTHSASLASHTGSATFLLN